MPPASAAVHELVEANLPLARYIARRIWDRIRGRVPFALDFEDLYGYAVLGLYDAARRFDPDRGFKFATFAGRTVHGSVLKALRDQLGPVRNWSRHRVKTYVTTLEGFMEAHPGVEFEDPARPIEELEESLSLAQLFPGFWDSLTDRERAIVAARVLRSETQGEIAEELGISQMHVSRIINTRIRPKLRAALAR